MLTKLGGRKFLFAIIIIGVATAVELYTERGITNAFAGLLGLIYTAFASTNFAVSNSWMKSKSGSESGKDIKQLANSVQALKETVDNTGQVAVNLSKTIHDAINVNTPG